MPVGYNAALKTTRMTDVVTAMDAAGAGSHATLEIGSAGMGAVLAVITLDFPSATVTGAVLTLAGTPLVCPSAANTGTAAAARIKDGFGAVIIDGLTVSASGGADITLTSTSIIATESVTLTSGTITHG